MKIDYPTQEELNQSIVSTIENAYPRNGLLFDYLVRLYKDIGFQNVMHGMEKVMLLLCAGYALLIGVTCNQEIIIGPMVYLFIVIVSPIVFQLLLLLFYIGGLEQGVYEVEMSCKYTMYHLLVFRMGIVGIFSTIMNGLFFMSFIIVDDISIHLAFRFALLSVSALFIYGGLYVRLIMKRVDLLSQIILYLLWIVGACFIRCIFPTVFEYIAIQIPIIVHIIIWIGIIVIIFKMIRTFLYKNCKYNLNIGGSYANT